MQVEPNTGSQQDDNSDPGPSMTISAFCKKHSISKTLFRNLQIKGRGPKLLHLNRAIRISAKAEKRWLADRERLSAIEAQEAKARSRQASEAGKAGGISRKRIAKKRNKRANGA